MKKTILSFLACILLCPAVGAKPLPFPSIPNPQALVAQPVTKPVAPGAQELATQRLGKADLLFIENNGQLLDDAGKAHPEVLFTARAGNTHVFVTATSIHYAFIKREGGQRASSVSMRPDRNQQREEPIQARTERFTVNLVGANANARLVKEQENPYYENYFLSHCPKGITAKSYERFRLVDVYPGVDWVLYSNGQGMKYDFVVKQASQAGQIKLQVTGAQASLAPNGSLVMAATLGQITEEKPVSFQAGKTIETRFTELGNGTFGFALENAVANQPLTIDPSVLLSTITSKTSFEFFYKSVADSQGSLYLTGLGYPQLLPGTTPVSGSDFSALVVKLDAAGNRLWATYVGGSFSDRGEDIALAPNGDFYLTGVTSSSNFPALNSGSSSEDVFVARFTAAGTLQWATRYGGSSDEDYVTTCVVDHAGNVYIAGDTKSTDLPVLRARNGFGRVISNYYAKESYWAKFSSAGQLIWATYVGGIENERVGGCVVDDADNVYLSINSNSPDFMSVNNLGLFGPGGAYIIKADSAGNWKTWYALGVGRLTEINSMAVSPSGQMILAGQTADPQFQTLRAFQSTLADTAQPVMVPEYYSDAFLLAIDTALQLQWSTYYGAIGRDVAMACTVDDFGCIYVGGNTYSGSFPMLHAVQSAIDSVDDAFLAKFDPAGMPLWSTYYGGNWYDWISSIAVTSAGAIYATGSTYSSDFPLINSAPSIDTIGYGGSILMKLQDCQLGTAPAIAASAPLAICGGDSVVLRATGDSRIVWNNGQMGNSIVVKQSGTYQARSLIQGCVSPISTPVSVVVTPIPAKPAITRPSNDTLAASTVGSSYLWYHDGVLLPGATTQRINMGGTPGLYTVRAVNNTCSSAVSEAILVNSALSRQVPNLSVYPNPASGKFEIACDGRALKQATLTTVVGQRVFTQMLTGERATVDCRHLAAGTYILQVETADGVAIRKVVLE